MRNSSVLVGALAGLILSAILAVPLAIDLPHALVPRWPEVAGGGVLAAWLGALLVPIAAGYVAGRINADESVRAGSGAGTIAGLVALVFAVVPGAAVWSAGPVYLAVSGGRLTTTSVEGLLADALVRAAWAPAVASIGTVLLSLATGAIGGFFAEISSGVRRSREVHRSSVPMVGLFAVAAGTVVHSVLAAHAELTLLPALHQPIGVLGRLGLAAPHAAAGVANALLLMWTVRDAALLWRSGRRAGALGWAMLSGVMVFSGHLVASVLYPYAWIGPWPWLAVAAEGAACLLALVLHRGSDTILAEAPRHWFELAIEGFEMGVVSTGLFTLAGGGAVSAWTIQLLPVAWAVASGGDRLELDARHAVVTQYTVHLGAPVPMILVAVTYAVLATPLWLVGLAVLRRAEARGT